MYRRNNWGPRTHLRGSLDTGVTSLLRQPFTTTCCDRLKKTVAELTAQYLKCPRSRASRESFDCWPRQKWLWNLSEQFRHLLCTQWSVSHTQKGISSAKTFPIANCAVGSIPLQSINRAWQTDTSFSNTFNSIGIIQINLQLAGEVKGDSFSVLGYHCCYLYRAYVSAMVLLLLKKMGNARLGEGDWHPISPKTPAPRYQPIEEKKKNGK